MVNTIAKIVKGFHIHGYIGGKLWASHCYSIYAYEESSDDWHLLGKIPENFVKIIVCKIRVLQRLLRSGIHKIIELQNGNILIICDRIFFVSDLTLSFFRISNITIKSFQVLDHSVFLHQGVLHYGEYYPNFSKEAISIYSSHDGLNWETKFSFPSNSIKHIHLIQYDSYSKRFWFSTGDNDNECVLANANTDFSNAEIVGHGSQKWRSLELLFDSKNIYWGTDNPNGDNWLVSFNRKTKEITKLANFGGPIYNLKKVDNGYIIITTTEGGAGEWDNCAHIWYSYSLEEPHWLKCASFKKDWMPNIFGFGRAIFCMAINNLICVYCVGLANVDNSSVFIELY